jgi:iron complex outermembrane recepter protein
MMKFTTIGFFLLFSFNLLAQRPTGGQETAPRTGGAPAPAVARVYGKVLDNASGEPLSYASVTLKPMRKDSILAGELTKNNGFFDLKGLPVGMYQLKITSLGYADTVLQIRLVPPAVELDAGNIRLRTNSKVLNEVSVTGNRQSVELAVDRRIYTVEKNLAATGGSAIDALKNIPAVSVTTDGTVELRNSTPLIFIDGKPSLLTLDQIPAGEIDKIEIITNPSARYEASAAGGIINIVLKKNKLPGIFGMASAGVGTNHRYNGMANISLRQSPFGLNASYNFNTGQNPARSFNSIQRYDPTGANTTRFEQNGTNTSRRRMQMIRLGLDYDLNARNTISVSGTINTLDLRFIDDQAIENRLANQNIEYLSTRDALTSRDIKTYTTQFDYKRTFPKAGREWISFVQYTHTKNIGGTNVDQKYTDANGKPITILRDQIATTGYTKGPTLQFQTDYIHPFGNKQKLEFGARHQVKDNASFTDALRVDTAGELARFDLLSVNYAYQEQITAAYSNYMGRTGKWGYQAGLRLEQSIFSGNVPGDDSTFQYRFPKGIKDLHYLFFPSFFGTYTVKEGQDIQFNLSRKLERPNFFQVMPFVWQQDNQSYRTGNPNILPEFKYLAEVNYAITKKWGNYFSSIYGRYEDQPITPVVRRSTDGTESLINTFINGDNSIRVGIEQNIKYKITPQLDATLGGNIFRNQVRATFDGQKLDRTAWNWDLRSAIEYRFLKNWIFQTNGEYEAPRVIPQGISSRQYGFDIALKRNFNPLGSVTLQVSDVLNSRGRSQIFENANYTQETYRRREVRFIQISAQYRFGKPDASIFKQKRGSGRPGGGGDMEF